MSTRWFPVPLTADHLARGKRQDCHRCPVVLALEEATGWPWSVGERDAMILKLDIPAWKGNALWTFPPSVRQLIRDIDAGRPVEPTILRVPRRFQPVGEAS